jgi:hypothetical protein
MASEEDVAKFRKTFFDLRTQLIVDERSECAFYKAASGGVLGSLFAERYGVMDKLLEQHEVKQIVASLFRGADLLDDSGQELGSLSSVLVAYVAAQRIETLRNVIEADARADIDIGKAMKGEDDAE